MAPTKSIVGGNFQDALGNLVTGNLLLVLPQDAQIAGGGPIAPIHVRIPVNGGAVASTPIWFNDQMQPGNLAYVATVYDSTGNKVYGPELWSLTGASPFNLSTIVPLLISPDPLFSNPVLQNPGSLQTITGQGLTLTASAPFSVSKELIGTSNAFRWVGPAGSPQFATLEAAQTDCQNDATINSCAIHVVSGFRETFTSTIVVGSATKATIFYLQPDVTLTCNVAGGADCFQVMPASGFVGLNNFHSGLAGGLSGGPIITVASTANIGNVITTAQGGSVGGQSSIRLENLLLPGTGAGGETVTNWLHIQSVNNQPIISNIFVNPSANSVGVLIDASTATGAVMGPISLYNVFSDCQYRTGCRPAKITTGSPTANSVYNIDWNGGYINHPGSGLPNLEINGNSNTSKAIANIRIKAYFENLQNGSSIGLKIVDAFDVDWSTSGFLMQDTDTCVDISQSAAGRTGSLHATVFRCQSGTSAVKVINNHISGLNFTASSNQDVPLYNFGSDGTISVAPMIVDSNTEEVNFLATTSPGVGTSFIQSNNDHIIRIGTSGEGLALGAYQGSTNHAYISFNRNPNSGTNFSSVNSYDIQSDGTNLNMRSFNTAGTFQNTVLKLGQTGLPSAVGLQIFNTTTTCTTAASVGATCTTAAITLPVAEPDTSYRVTCTGKGLTAVPVVIATTNSSATQFTITIAALTAVAASFASYDCVCGHN